jgi:hypothetical protein
MAFKTQTRPCSRLHVYVCTPAYNGQVDGDYAQSLAETTFCCPMYNIQITAGDHRQRRIHRARAQHVREEVLRGIQGLHASDLHRRRLEIRVARFVGLVRSGLPICAGLYRRRQANEDYPAQAHRKPRRRRPLVRQRLAAMRTRADGLPVHLSSSVLEEMAAEAPCMEVADQKGGVPWLFDLKKEDVKATGERPIAKTYGEAQHAASPKARTRWVPSASSARTTRSRDKLRREVR